MKLYQEDQTIYGNTSSATSFKISSSAKAFKILSSNLYKNKIRAIARELICNALDAHRLAGNTNVQFEIKAPTQIDPRFIVRDFGPGLSEEDITEMYTTYFASSKDDSNDYTGALGLGSKSPFSYTETFSVTSYHGGKIRGYVALLMNGEPVLKPTFVEDMKEDDKTGLEVVVPVKLTDITRWETEIKYVIRPFGEYDPIVRGIDIEEGTYLPLDDYFTGRDFVNRYEGNGPYAVYGNIVYPLQDVPGINVQWLTRNSTSIYFRFPLGQLDIAPSREELSLDEKTIENIIAVTNKVNTEQFEDSVKQLRAMDNEREFVRAYEEFGYSAQQIINSQLGKVNGKTVDEWKQEIRKSVDTATQELVGYRFYQVTSYQTNLCRITTGNSYSRSKSAVHGNRIFGYAKKTCNVLIDDVKNRNILPTMRGLVRNNDVGSGEYILVVHVANAPQVLPIVETVMGKDEVKIYYASQLESVRMLDLSYQEVKDATAEKRPASPNVLEYNWSEKSNYYFCKEHRMLSSEIQDLDPSIPVVFAKREAFHDYDTLARRNADHDQVRKLAAIMKVKKFYAVRSSAINQFKKIERVNLYTYLFDRLTKYYKSKLRNNDFRVESNDYRVFGILERIDDLRFIARKYTDVKANLSYTDTSIQELTYHLGELPEELLKLAMEYKQKCNDAENEIEIAVEKFEKDHPILNYYLYKNTVLSSNSELVQNVIEVFNASTKVEEVIKSFDEV